MAHYIDRAPPPATGDARRDLQNILEYLGYLQEQMNYILAQQKKSGGA